jgi:probable F420-dependent oxidoreductase
MAPLGLGILSPVVTLTAGSHASWEREAGIDDVVRIARAAEALGYDHLTCSEHVAVPTAAVPVRGGTYWDPLATFGYVAAGTERIRLATDVLVLGYHHPLEIAKRYGTLDRISGGRLVLGLGVGSLREEFELLGVPFDDRGARADDHVRALRASLSVAEPSYHGPYYSFADVVVDPCAVQPQVPLWIGGRTARSLRRAVELADGWCPFALDAAEVAALLAAAATSAAWASRTEPLEVVLQNQRPVDPVDAPDVAAGVVDDLRAAGATMLSLRFVHHSLEHYLEQLEAMVAVVG